MRKYFSRLKISTFGEKVYITRLCWEHILFHKERSITDKLSRLKNLPLAKEVLESVPTYKTKRISGPYVLYGLLALEGNTIVKVIVSSRGGNGKKELYSVMFSSNKKR